MGVLANVVTSAQPALFGDGVSASGTAGATWKWTFTGMTDSTGATVNLSTVTGTCLVTAGVSGSTVATLTFAGASDGSFTLTCDESLTAGLAAGATTQGRPCRWYLSITDATDVVQAWGPLNSHFIILPGA